MNPIAFIALLVQLTWSIAGVPGHIRADCQPIVCTIHLTADSFVAIGDSMTVRPEGDPWPVHLDAMTDRLTLAHNSAATGQTSAGLVNHFNTEVLRYKPAYVFILIGAIDLHDGVAPEQIVKNVGRVEALARSAGIRTILLLVPYDSVKEIQAGIKTLDGELVTWAAGAGVRTIDLRPMSTHSTYIKQYTSDGVHFNSQGVAKVCQMILASLGMAKG